MTERERLGILEKERAVPLAAAAAVDDDEDDDDVEDVDACPAAPRRYRHHRQQVQLELRHCNTRMRIACDGGGSRCGRSSM